ncbi:MAG: 2-dehydro-3-deoxygalactonokinase [Sporomusaceae bacterium]|jgi:2-dehydro-3-deoxygalactonokinase|nr:2-dehydro-3-deoxygalactonokinase [Sporomusaceae bacterium]
MSVITIDAGTSNTRAALWQNGLPVKSAAEPVGCRDTALTGSKDALKEAVRKVIGQVKAEDTQAIVASGMITSNLGLAEIPHLELPAGKKELAAALTAVEIPEVWHKPLWFVPGLKQTGAAADTWENLADFDVIRGEETEIIALVDKLNLAGKPAWLALPGSHSKYIYLNAKGQVEYFFTTLAGEMFAAVAGNTILAGSAAAASLSGTAGEDLFAGYHAALKTGIARACFLVRPAHLFGSKTESARSDFLLGAVLASDLELLKQKDAILKNPAAPIIIAGRSELKTAIAALISAQAQFQGRVIETDTSGLAGHGALLLAKEGGILT